MNPNTKQIANRRIQILFERAKAVYKTNPALSNRYVEIARRLAMSAKVRLPIEYRRRICKKCNSLLVQGSNCRVRLKQRREPHVVVTCLNCGNQTRYLLRKKRSQKSLE